MKYTFSNVHSGEMFSEVEVLRRARDAAAMLRELADDADRFAAKVVDETITEDDQFLDLTNGGLDESNPPFVIMDAEESVEEDK